jgi:cytochrome c5
MIPRKFRLIATLFAATLLSACDSHSHGPPADLATLKPADPHLAALYQQSCKACHATPASGAPLVHDHDQWDPRWDQGLDVLTQHAVAGFRAMPAGGQCSSCSLHDYQALIKFMADREDSK